ncbi:hypothetical protein [Streptomyces sp. NPDC019890]|uniref:hypothetical protein n=1 Tax=Streptomyces sp. NPDC019890 TaxID=3365064 RepID=UPI00384CF92D
MPDPITLMAAGELRTALEAQARGDLPAAAAALMSIDRTSWQAIEHRLATLGGTLPELLAAVRSDAA